MNGKEVLKILVDNGFEVKSQKGSHIKLIKDEKTIIVPLHGAKDIPTGTLKSIEKSSEISLIKDKKWDI